MLQEASIVLFPGRKDNLFIHALCPIKEGMLSFFIILYYSIVNKDISPFSNPKAIIHFPFIYLTSDENIGSLNFT